MCLVRFDGLLCVAEPLRFALLIPFSGPWSVGKQIAGAATLAVQQVNADKALLPEHVLEYSWADSGCSAKKGLRALGDLLFMDDAQPIDAIIGPGCSTACEVMGSLADRSKEKL